MSANSPIQWTDATWNPIRGCSRVSAGCTNCYAETIAARFSGPGLPYEGLARRRSNGEPQWTGVVRVIEKHMMDPLSWRQPRRIFVNSMSDLFHENVSDETIHRVFAVMALAPRHTFQLLTKRPERMRDMVCSEAFADAVLDHIENDAELWESSKLERDDYPIQEFNRDIASGERWPLPNVWLGVSVENQAAANERIPLLAQTPAAIRFLSCEPLLGPIDFYEAGSRGGEDGDPFAFSALRGTDGTDPSIPGIDWCIVGGESGARARDFHLAWARSIVAQCRAAGVAPFVKQLGRKPTREFGPLSLRDSHGADMEEWPEDLRVREFPTITKAVA